MRQADFNTSGGLVGGTLGYNYQMGQAVFGLEGDIDWSNIRGSASACAGTTCETRNDWLGTARGRIGYAFDRFMPYVTGGAAFGDIKASAAGIGDANETKAGWTVGGGVEAAIAGPWTAKVEYLYVDLGRGASFVGSDTAFKPTSCAPASIIASNRGAERRKKSKAPELLRGFLRYAPP